MAARASSRTSGEPRSTRETDDFDTPARAATSMIVRAPARGDDSIAMVRSQPLGSGCGCGRRSAVPRIERGDVDRAPLRRGLLHGVADEHGLVAGPEVAADLVVAQDRGQEVQGL